MISLSLNFEIVARHYFEGFYSRDFNRQLLNKGIKFHDLRVLNFILFFKMTSNLFLQFYFLGVMSSMPRLHYFLFRIIVTFTNRLKETHRE